MKTTKYLLMSVAMILVTVAAVLVSKPAPTSPRGNVLVTDYTPTLKWSASTPNAYLGSYQVQVARDSSFSAATIVVPITAVSKNQTSFVVPVTLDPAMKYYWRVRAVDVNNVKTEWTATYFRTAVKPPTLVSPANGAALLSNRPSFEWNGVLDADSYTLQVSQYYGFDTTLVNQTISATSGKYTLTTDLPVRKTLYWRMRTNSATFGPSAWTPVRTLTTANPPSIPELTQPNDGKLTDDYSPRLVWNKVTLPSGTSFDHYQIQVALNDEFEAADIVFDDSTLTNINDPFYEVDELTPLDPATTYYWRVRAYNTAGEYSSWSDTFSLLTVIEPVSVLYTPANGITLTNNRPLFDWKSVKGATKYYIVISKYPSLTDWLIYQRVYASQFRPATGLPAGTLLYWRVQALGGKYGTSPWSETYSFTTATPPGKPTELLPEPNTLVKTFTPTFTWQPSNVPESTTFKNYQIQVSTTSTYTAPVINDDNLTQQYVTTYTVQAADALDPMTKYYWRLRACNTALQCSGWTPAATNFILVAIQPPTLLTPANGSTVGVYPFRPTLDWSDVYGASSTSGNTPYRIQVATAPNMTGIVLDRAVSSSMFKFTTDLPAGTYYWRVLTNNAYGFGPSSWSTRWSFIIDP